MGSREYLSQLPVTSESEYDAVLLRSRVAFANIRLGGAETLRLFHACLGVSASARTLPRPPHRGPAFFVSGRLTRAETYSLIG
jgi:hypothetical protein